MSWLRAYADTCRCSRSSVPHFPHFPHIPHWVDVRSILPSVPISTVLGGSEGHSCADRKTPKRKEQRVWMIPSNSKFFDLDGCFKKYGCVYWRQHVNFQKGDIGYIYSAYPNSAILYKVSIDGHDLTYTAEMEREKEFYTNSNRLNLAHLLEHGMKAAPQGALNLSHPSFAELLNYIEEYF